MARSIMGYGIWFQPIWIGWKVWKKPRHIFHFKKRAWFPRTTWFMDGFHWNINLNLKVEARFSSYLIEQVLLVILILSLHIGNLLFQTPYLILHFSHVTRLFPKPEKYVRFIKLREQATHTHSTSGGVLRACQGCNYILSLPKIGSFL